MYGNILRRECPDQGPESFNFDPENVQNIYECTIRGNARRVRLSKHSHFIIFYSRPLYSLQHLDLILYSSTSKLIVGRSSADHSLINPLDEIT